jgi:hypothetical protein
MGLTPKRLLEQVDLKALDDGGDEDERCNADGDAGENEQRLGPAFAQESPSQLEREH